MHCLKLEKLDTEHCNEFIDLTRMTKIEKQLDYFVQKLMMKDARHLLLFPQKRDRIHPDRRNDRKHA